MLVLVHLSDYAGADKAHNNLNVMQLDIEQFPSRPKNLFHLSETHLSINETNSALLQPSYQTQSETIGAIVREELNSVYPTNPYLLKRNVGVWVLDQNVCPSVLVECGFLTDEKDKAFITKEANHSSS